MKHPVFLQNYLKLFAPEILIMSLNKVYHQTIFFSQRTTSLVNVTGQLLDSHALTHWTREASIVRTSLFKLSWFGGGHNNNTSNNNTTFYYKWWNFGGWGVSCRLIRLVEISWVLFWCFNLVRNTNPQALKRTCRSKSFAKQPIAPLIQTHITLWKTNVAMENHHF